MKRLILLTAILLTSTVVLAEDTTTETCANGAGTVITGAVTGHKYCMSNNTMNWWNAHAWCDAIGDRLFSLNDCEYSVTGGVSCPDIVRIGGGCLWTVTPVDGFNASCVDAGGGIYGRDRDGGRSALCYQFKMAVQCQ